MIKPNMNTDQTASADDTFLNGQGSSERLILLDISFNKKIFATVIALMSATTVVSFEYIFL